MTKEPRQELEGPHDLNAEMAVLGGIMLLNGKVEKALSLGAAKELNPESFYNGKHGRIFAAIVELVNQGTPADIVTLCEHLGARKELEAVGGAGYISELLDAVPTTEHLPHYVRIVKKKSLQRKLIAAAGKVTERGYAGAELDELEEEVKALARISSYSAELEPEPLRLELGREPEPPGKSLGWETTDRKELYIHPNELTLIAGRPGHGKTTLILNLMLNWCGANKDERLVFYSYEINPKGLIWTLYSILTGCLSGGGDGFSYYDVRDYLTRGPEALAGRNDQPELMDKAEAVLRRYTTEGKQLYCEYCPAWPVDRVEAHARKLAEKGPIGAVFVDYVQKVQAPKGTKYERNDLRLTAVVERFQYLSKELRCPVIVASQLNRETVQGNKIPEGLPFDDPKVQKAIRQRRPMLNHLRDSGGLEQEADLVLGLHNYRADYKENPEDGPVREDDSNLPSPLELIVLKARHGKPGRVCPLTLYGRTSRIDG